MDNNDFERYSAYESSGNGDYTPSWDDFTLDDEARAKKRFSRVFLALFLYQIISIVLVYGAEFAAAFLYGEAVAEKFNYTALLIVNSIASYCVAFPTLFFITRPLRSSGRAKRSIGFVEFLKIFLVAEAFMYVGNVIGTFFNNTISMFTGAEIENSIASIIENTPMWMIILIPVVIGPIFEELIFRKIMIDKLDMYGDRVAIIVSAIAFGLFHGNLYQFFYAAMLGAVLGYLYTRTGNILWPIGLHMLINLFGSAIPMLFMDDINAYYELVDKFSAGIEIDMAEMTRLTLTIGAYSLVEMAMVIAGIVIFLKEKRNIFISDRCEVLIPKRMRLGVIIGNVGAILFIILSALSIGLEIVMPIINNILEGAPAVPDAPANDGLPGTDSSIWRYISLWK